MSTATSKKFELAGSKPHYTPTKQFAIKHLKLEIKPNFDGKSIECRETIDIIPIEDNLQHVILDAAELNIRSVHVDGKGLQFKALEEKVRIELPTPATEDEQVRISINYDTKPRRGFFFVKPDKDYPNKQLQAWTQGEATESKY